MIIVCFHECGLSGPEFAHFNSLSNRPRELTSPFSFQLVLQNSLTTLLRNLIHSPESKEMAEAIATFEVDQTGDPHGMYPFTRLFASITIPLSNSSSNHFYSISDINLENEPLLKFDLSSLADSKTTGLGVMHAVRGKSKDGVLPESEAIPLMLGVSFLSLVIGASTTLFPLISL